MAFTSVTPLSPPTGPLGRVDTHSLFEFARESDVQKGDMTWAKSQDSADLDRKLGF